MKKIFTLLATVLFTATAWAQSPEKMSYQAVIRNSSDQLVTDTQVGMQISILQGSASGTEVYVETQTPTTNANGLISIEIGNGTLVSGDFTTIDWANGLYFIKTETDPTGGTNYTITGTNQLLSVPYALHAKTVNGITSTNITDWNTAFGWGDHSTVGYFAAGGEAGGTDRTLGNTDDYSLGFKTNDVTRLFIKNNGYVGIGTTNPNAPLHITTTGNYIAHALTSGTSDLIFNVVPGSTKDFILNNNGAGGGIALSIGNSKKLIVANGGNIGIGTASPAAKLEVADTPPGTNDPVAIRITNLRSSLDLFWELRAYDSGAGGPYGRFSIFGGTSGGSDKLVITTSGNVGIGTTDPKSKLHVVGLPEYADNAAAITAGLTVGSFYRTGDQLKVVH